MSMQVIEHIEVGSGGAASIEFTSIPATYTDLYLVVSARGDSGTWQKLNVRPNGSTANDSSRWLIGDGSGTGSSTEANILGRDYSSSSTTANTFGSGSIYIPNYTSSSAKSFSIDTVGENNATEAIQSILAGLWDDTTAISSIELVFASASFVQYSSATLYGIKSAAKASKATGGIISFDSVNNKWVHTFTSSGTFTPTEDLAGVEYLVIAGGGSGGSSSETVSKRGGGGGAGGYRSSVSGEPSGGGASAESTLSLTSSTAYTVTVGAGGSPATPPTNGTGGSSSSFDSLVSTVGGGHGGNNYGTGGGSGGSGGGGGQDAGGGGAGTAGEGFAGSAGTGTDSGTGGGAGSAASGATAGSGVSSSITGSAVTRAIGGSRRTSGNPNSAADGAANTGNGGQGATKALTGDPYEGGNGGSGVVIVRYDA